jgi:hypothetical protein
VAVALTVLTTGLAAAQTPVTLPASSQATTLSADVSEQAQLTVPAGVTFNVANIGAATVASVASVTVDGIVLATATKQLKISLQANAASFTPSVVSADTWSASDVSWNAATFSNGGVGATGTLSESAYNQIATCAADVVSCSTTNLEFTLAENAAVKRSGAHTLTMTWKFESIGS